MARHHQAKGDWHWIRLGTLVRAEDWAGEGPK